MTKEKGKMVTIQELLEMGRYPIKYGTIKGWLLNRHVNGLAPHVKRVGRNNWIDLEGFERWIQSKFKGGC